MKWEKSTDFFLKRLYVYDAELSNTAFRLALIVKTI